MEIEITVALVCALWLAQLFPVNRENPPVESEAPAIAPPAGEPWRSGAVVCGALLLSRVSALSPGLRVALEIAKVREARSSQDVFRESGARTPPAEHDHLVCLVGAEFREAAREFVVRNVDGAWDVPGRVFFARADIEDERSAPRADPLG
jgi:hypothetical protein